MTDPPCWDIVIFICYINEIHPEKQLKKIDVYQNFRPYSIVESDDFLNELEYS